jgi:hypothetical protein
MPAASFWLDHCLCSERRARSSRNNSRSAAYLDTTRIVEFDLVLLGAHRLRSVRSIEEVVLGAVLTVGGAFIPDLPVKQSAKQKPETGGVNIALPGQAKVSFKGTPRYAVLAVGLIIVLSSLWDGYAASH